MLEEKPVTDEERAKLVVDVLALKIVLLSLCQAVARQPAIDAAILHADFLDAAERFGLESATLREMVRVAGVCLTHGGQRKSQPDQPPVPSD